MEYFTSEQIDCLPDRSSDKRILRELGKATLTSVMFGPVGEILRSVACKIYRTNVNEQLSSTSVSLFAQYHGWSGAKTMTAEQITACPAQINKLEKAKYTYMENTGFIKYSALLTAIGLWVLPGPTVIDEEKSTAQINGITVERETTLQQTSFLRRMAEEPSFIFAATLFPLASYAINAQSVSLPTLEDRISFKTFPESEYTCHFKATQILGTHKQPTLSYTLEPNVLSYGPNWDAECLSIENMIVMPPVTLMYSKIFPPALALN